MAGETSSSYSPSSRADVAWDDYAERVLRNEGRLQALEILVAETREADNKLIEMRSEALEKILEARSAALADLYQENRNADQSEYRHAIEALTELHERAIRLNFEQSNTQIANLEGRTILRIEAVSAEIHSLEQRREAATSALTLQVTAWRDSDREARELQAREYERRLQALNGEHTRTAHVLLNSISREVFQSEKDGIMAAIATLDRSLLGMTPRTESEKAHSDMIGRFETLVNSASSILDTKINVAQGQIAELKEYVDKTTGRGAGMSALYGWAVAAIGLIISVVIFVNTILSK